MEEQANLCSLFIVEDDDDDRLLLSNKLKEFGFLGFTRFFPSEKDLIDFYNSNKHISGPSIILLDIFMGGEKDKEAITNIRKVKDLSQVPIIIMLGAENEKEYIKQKGLEVDGYMVKPLNLKLLIRYIESIS